MFIHLTFMEPVSDALAHTKMTQLRSEDSDSAVHTNLPHLCTETLGGCAADLTYLCTQTLKLTITLQPWGVGWG